MERTPAFAATATYSIYEIPLLPGFTHAEAAAINDAGTVVVGTTHVFNAEAGRAFRWSFGQVTDLGVLPGHTSSEAFDVNDSGIIVGVSWPKAPGGGHAFVYVPGIGMLTMHPGSIAEWTQAFGISNAGVVVGTAKLWSGEYRAFRWSWSKGFELLPNASGHSEAADVNESGMIVGQAFVGSSDSAFVWRPDGTGLSLGLKPAYAINDQGIIAGLGYIFQFGSRNGPQKIPGLVAKGISEPGRVVGFFYQEGAATWYKGQITILPGLHPNYGSDAYDVSTCGTIVGRSTKPATYGPMGRRPVVWYKSYCDSREIPF